VVIHFKIFKWFVGQELVTITTADFVLVMSNPTDSVHIWESVLYNFTFKSFTWQY